MTFIVLSALCARKSHDQHATSLFLQSLRRLCHALKETTSPEVKAAVASGDAADAAAAADASHMKLTPADASAFATPLSTIVETHAKAHLASQGKWSQRIESTLLTSGLLLYVHTMFGGAVWGLVNSSFVQLRELRVAAAATAAAAAAASGDAAAAVGGGAAAAAAAQKWRWRPILSAIGRTSLVTGMLPAYFVGLSVTIFQHYNRSLNDQESLYKLYAGAFLITALPWWYLLPLVEAAAPLWIGRWCNHALASLSIIFAFATKHSLGIL
jgi:hypothetical protein